MEIIGDDKRLRALYSETRFVDEQAAPSFLATWHRAQARATQPRRAFNLALASAMALVIFAVGAFVIWSNYSQPTQMYSVSAWTAAAEIVTLPIKGNSEVTEPNLPVRYATASTKSRSRKLAVQRQQLLIAESRKAEKEAKEIASWQSPTASLLSSSSDDLFKSLPQLNENAKEMKSFLPNRANDKEN